MSDSPLPKEQLLLKILKMTTSDNDGQALVAIRKANALLDAAGWTWDKLIEGKIKIVESPFKNMPTPSKPVRAEPPPTYNGGGSSMAGAARSAPRPGGRAPYPTSFPRAGCRWDYDAGANTWMNVPLPATPSPPPPPRPTGLRLSRKNLYATDPRKGCYCCGVYVANEAGFIMKPSDFNAHYSNKWEIVCAPCNRTKRDFDIGPTPARVQTGETIVVGSAPNLESL